MLFGTAVRFMNTVTGRCTEGICHGQKLEEMFFPKVEEKSHMLN